jgi:hypothetical protein
MGWTWDDLQALPSDVYDILIDELEREQRDAHRGA